MRILLVEDEYDVLVLDWLLPGKDGLAVCRALRDSGNSIPILMLTARDGVADRVSGRRTGAECRPLHHGGSPPARG